MYWAPGAAHGPHHIFKEWADKYKGQFDDGWDALRERIFKRQKELGWIPADAKLTPRAETMAAWDSIPEAERPFQRTADGSLRRLHRACGRAGRQGHRRSRRARHSRQHASSSISGATMDPAPKDRTARSANCWPRTAFRTRRTADRALDNIGGLDALGGPKTDNMYHAGWAWAGDTPFQYTKLVASHFGGTRNPMAISWPARIKPDKTPRPQFHHVNDIVPTIYEILGIKPPKWLMVSSRTRSMASAWSTRSPTPTRQAQKAHAILRQQRQPRHLSRRLVCLHVRAVRLGTPPAPGLVTPGIRTRTSGSSTTSRRTSRRRRSRREISGAARRR